MMLAININEELGTPMFIQICEEIKNLIDTGILSEGDKLPSSRKLSEQLDVHRSTVYKAYEELWAAGYIESKPGSYSTVRQRSKLNQNTISTTEDLFDWDLKVNKHIHSVSKEINAFKSNYGPEFINFLPVSPDPSLIPANDLRKSLNHVLNKYGSDLLNYNGIDGYLPLREYLAKQMKIHGINTSPDEIILTNGVQNSLELLINLLYKPGSYIIIEEPSYSSAIDLFKLYNLNLIAIPVTQDGIDLEKLESKLKNKDISFIYTMPNFHNPYSITSPASHREQLIKICNKYEVPIIEDGFEEDLKYFGKAVPPLKSMDSKGMVVYLGTYSKILFPGLRIGWISANIKAIEYLKVLKRATQITDNHLLQAALHHYCESGYLVNHLNKMHRTYRKRMTVATKLIKAYINKPGILYNLGNGGYTFWFELIDCKISEAELVKKLKENKILVTPGSNFYLNPTDSVTFRISIAHTNEDQIEKGIITLADILNNL
ncbi:MAG: PLP-dependent aminotransferase family protein [Salinivirgaceae bacterium]|nr:PLP-dependent aminotransferase family protein [Salinivirgaceae bacterium]